jgi:hypothetical protein
MFRAATVLLAVFGSACALKHPIEFYEEKFVDWLHDFNMTFHDGREFVHRLRIFAGERPSL